MLYDRVEIFTRVEMRVVNLIFKELKEIGNTFFYDLRRIISLWYYLDFDFFLIWIRTALSSFNLEIKSLSFSLHLLIL